MTAGGPRKKAAAGDAPAALGRAARHATAGGQVHDTHTHTDTHRHTFSCVGGWAEVSAPAIGHQWGAPDANWAT
eukprot:1055951-Pyramimonas_sp.AAC.1